MKVPVIINNRDLLTWTKEMVDKIKTYNNVGDIIILDNGSTYKPLIEWYDTKPCEVIKIENLGHTAPWDSGLVKKLNSKYYIVSDSDLGIGDTPIDSIDYLTDKLEENNLEKIGFGLNYQITPTSSPYYNHVMTYEKNRYNKSRYVNDIYLDVVIDTTFALYKAQNYFIGGSCTSGSYSAKHYPWYLTNEERQGNDEFMYYIKNASASSSYKTYLKL